MKINDLQRTKIVATVGPASDSYEKLLELVKAGVDVFRLNFSHGTHEGHQNVINHIMYINEKYGTHIGILADLQGPKLRIGEVQEGGIPLESGDEIIFHNKPMVGNKEEVYMNYEKFAQDVVPGEKVLLDDGKLEMQVLETNQVDRVKLKITFGGILNSRKGVNLPDTKLSLPSLTEKDLKDLDFILTLPVNWIALSFVRTAQDIIDLKSRIDQKDHIAKVIAKIEKPEAVQNMKAIIKVSNAIMVARGDLGVEVPMERLPSIQKKIISSCIQWSRPVIVATQMMDSMIQNPSPTRAEITDVANAVYDGTDAVMLSGETSVGKHPVKVVEAMNKILAEAEKSLSLKEKRPKPSKKSRTFISDVVCFNAAKTAEDIGAKAIVGMTTSGYTAFKVSSYRPKSDIYIFSDVSLMLNTLSLVWGVRTFYYDKFSTTDETIEDVTQILKKANRLNEGDLMVNTGSMPIGRRFRTNMLKVTIVE